MHFAVVGVGYLVGGWRGAIIALAVLEVLKFLLNFPDLRRGQGASLPSSEPKELRTWPTNP